MYAVLSVDTELGVFLDCLDNVTIRKAVAVVVKGVVCLRRLGVSETKGIGMSIVAK